MKRVCKTKPSYIECDCCRRIAEEENKVTGCAECDAFREEYVLVTVYGKNNRGCAVIIKNGKLEEVEIERVFGIREVE